MKKRKFGLITEAFGHGFASALFTKTEKLTPVAFSDKETKEEFEAQVEQIFNNLVFFVPNSVKANWEERESYLQKGWNIRQDIIAGNITAE